MLSPKTIAAAIGVQPIITAEEQNKIQMLNAYYNGEAPHNIRTDDPIPSWQIPNTIVGEIYRNVTAEMESEIQSNDWLNEQWQPLIESWDEITEKAAALGETIIFPFVYRDKIIFNAYSRTMYSPVKYSLDGVMEAVVFQEYQTVGDMTPDRPNTFVLLTHCDWTDGTFTIIYKSYEQGATGALGKEVPLETVPAWKDLVNWEFPAARPWFVVYSAPKGESAFGKVLRLIDELEEQDHRITIENEFGETMFFGSSDIFKDIGYKDAKNPEKSQRIYDIPKGKERLFMVGQYSMAESAPYTHAPTLRNTDLIMRRDDIARAIETIVSINRGKLAKPEQVQKTATEVEAGAKPFDVLIEKYKNITKKVLNQLVIVYDEIARAYGLQSGYSELTCVLGDSIVLSDEQKQKIFKENVILLMSMASAGIVSKEFILAYALEYSDTFYTITDEMISDILTKLPDTFDEGTA